MSDFEIKNGVLLKYTGNAENITVPEGVTVIGDEAFAECATLTSVIIPKPVVSVGKNAFYKCENLQTIYCEAAKKPQDWSGNWLKKCRAKVVWDYDAAEAVRKAENSDMGQIGSKTKRSVQKNADLAVAIKKKAPLIAAMSGVVFLFVFAFSYFGLGNFNRPVEQITTAPTFTDMPSTTRPALTTQGTTRPAFTTQATTKPVPVIPDPVDVVVYYTMGEDPIAINVATNRSAGQLKLAEGSELELVQGNFYVATYYNGECTAKANLGAALKTSGICLGYSIIRSEASPYFDGSTEAKTWEEGKVIKPGGGWLKDISARPYTTNIYMDVAALNVAMGEYSTIGKFGTLKVTDVAGGEIFLDIDGAEVLASEMEVQFAYVSYDGKVIKTATNKEAKTPIANAVDLLRYANDTGHGEELGATAGVWQSVVDHYGAPGSTTMCTCDVCKGAINLQTHWTNLWLSNWQIPQVYNSALTKYNYIALDADALKVVLDKANSELDAAVANNPTVAALKAAAEAEGATYIDKNAYTNALEADEILKPLYEAYTEANTNYTNASTADEKAEEYTETLALWTEPYEKFCAAYEEAANLVLWDAEDMENSYLYKVLVNVDIETYPSFTYYYDAATDTYTIYITSMFNSGVSTRLS